MGFIGFQPSELMRFLLPISAAAYLTRNPQIKLSDWIIVLVTTLVAFILVFLQPDFGTSAIVLLSGIMPIILSGLPWRFIIYSFLGGIGTLPFLWMSLMDYQKERIYTFISPEADALGSGWNIAQSKIAIGSGGIFGKGFGEGTQSHLNFLPETETDFIFAVIAEEFGLIGLTILIGLYFFIFIRCFYLSINARDRFCRLVIGGLSLVFISTLFINIGMVIGLLPVVGMPLPLISQGGSSLISFYIAFGIIISMASHKKLVPR